MSAPSRGRGRGASSSTQRGQGSQRAGFDNVTRGRGRGRGNATTAANTGAAGSGVGLLQKLRNGTMQRSSENGATTANSRGRGSSVRGQAGTTRARGNNSKTFNAPNRTTTTTTPTKSEDQELSVPTAVNGNRASMTNVVDRFNTLKSQREAERRRAIQDGVLADPDKKMSLANAITPVGTCTEMCPEFERVERMVQKMIDKAERDANHEILEDRMVKRFRRSAAGYDEQLPSDIRTPETLRRTLDYLLDTVIAHSVRLAPVHKFVWDRTRGIRNDFSIQQVTRPEDVQIAVECYERIARFHILSLHQLSNDDNLLEGEHFDAHQEREQLNNTLISLMFYYEDHRARINLPNEAEFRSYLILFELQSLNPDLEERMQSWPDEVLNHPKVQTAFAIYAAAGNTVFDQGPLRPYAPFAIAQANSGKFWTILASPRVSYLMASVAEMNFNMVRYTALAALWRSGKSAPQGQQAKNQDWTVTELMHYLGFDNEEQTTEFCQEFGLAFESTSSGELYLDFTASNANTLDKSSMPSGQVFSYSIVEAKRYRRTLSAVMNNISVAAAIRQGLVVDAPDGEADETEHDDGQSLFIPEVATPQKPVISTSFGSNLNPKANAFSPGGFGVSSNTDPATKPIVSSKFGQGITQPSQTSIFGASSSKAAPPGSSNNATVSSSVFAGFGSAVTSGSNEFAPKPTPAVSTTTTATTAAAAGSFGSSDRSFQSPTVPPTTSPVTKAPTFSFGQSSSLFTPRAQQSSQVRTGSTPLGNEGYVFGKPVQLAVTETSSAQSPSQRPMLGPHVDSLSSFPGESFGQTQEEAPNEEKPAFAPPPVASAPLFSFTQPTVPQDALSVPTISPQPVPARDLTSATPVFSFSRTSTPPISNPSSVSLSTSAPPQLSLSSSNPDFSSGVAAPSLSGPLERYSDQSAISPSSWDVQTFPSPTGTTASTTPLSSPKRTSIGKAKPSVDTMSGKRDAAPTDTRSLSPLSKESDAPRGSKATIVEKHVSPPAEPLQGEANQVEREERDRARLLSDVARISFLQPQGLLEYFVSHHVSSILQKIMQDYHQSYHDKVIDHVKTRYLERKYFAFWKKKTQKSLLIKRGRNRRRLLTAIMQAEMQKKRREELELEEILAATQESRQIQEEQRRSKLEQEKTKVEAASATEQNQDSTQIVGMKRKGSRHSETKFSPSSTPAAGQSMHKRSRTIESTAYPHRTSQPPPANSSDAAAATSRFSQSYFGRSTASSDSHQSAFATKIDSTNTHYFKLKAMGIDPDTPLIPDTAVSLAAKEKRQETEQQLRMRRVRARRSTSSVRSQALDRTALMPPPPTSLPVTSHTSSESSHVAQHSQDLNKGDDEFLAQLRQARQAMSQDTEWFKSQTEELEKEIEQHEELRHSRQSSSNYSQNFALSNNGFASSNGFEYKPADSKPGVSLSRTERRIRATGAHGLATKNSARRTGDYVPVAMSRLSASRYGVDNNDVALDNTSSGQKRARPEADLALKHSQPSSSSNLRGEEPSKTMRSPVSKRFRVGDDLLTNRGGMPSSGSGSGSGSGSRAIPRATNNYFTSLEVTGDSDAGDSENDGCVNLHLHQGYLDDAHAEEDDGDGDADDDEDEEEEEDEAEEDELFEDDDGAPQGSEDLSDDDGDGSEAQERNTSHSRYGWPSVSRGSTASASQSGPGASLDDAVVLSD